MARAAVPHFLIYLYPFHTPDVSLSFHATNLFLDTHVTCVSQRLSAMRSQAPLEGKEREQQLRIANEPLSRLSMRRDRNSCSFCSITRQFDTREKYFAFCCLDTRYSWGERKRSIEDVLAACHTHVTGSSSFVPLVMHSTCCTIAVFHFAVACTKMTAFGDR